MTESASPHATIAALLQRYGIDGLSQQELAEFAAMAERVTLQTVTVRRMPNKTDEPAHVFRVGRKRP